MGYGGNADESVQAAIGPEVDDARRGVEELSNVDAVDDADVAEVLLVDVLPVGDDLDRPLGPRLAAAGAQPAAIVWWANTMIMTRRLARALEPPDPKAYQQRWEQPRQSIPSAA
jgi:hypothetical protein